MKILALKPGHSNESCCIRSVYCAVVVIFESAVEIKTVGQKTFFLLGHCL